MEIKEVIATLEKLRADATPGTWHISKLDGQWAAASSSPLMEALAASFGKIGGGPERPIGETDFSQQDDAYALACINASPILIAEVTRLQEALSAAQKKPKVKKKAPKKKAAPRRKKRSK